MKISSQHRLLMSALLLILGIFIAIELALKAPLLDIRFNQDLPSEQFMISATGSNPSAHFADNSVITEIAGVTLRPELRIEEPDQLPTWAQYNAFMSDMSKIYQASLSGSVVAIINDQAVTLPVRERTLLDLPGLFWLQVIIAGLAFLIASGVYAFKTSSIGAQQFFFAGLGLGLFALSASIYSTREFIFNGNWILILSNSNQLGATFFTAALVALLSQYPHKISKNFNLTPWIYLLGLIIWLGFSLQLYSETSWVYLLTTMLFSTTFILAYQQWQRTRETPVERASLKWYLLSIYMGTGLFAIFILIPVSLGIAPPASQGMMFLVFLLMFIGIAFGIIRYRLFELDRWWLSAWSWFLGGVSLIALDALLISAIGLNTETALALSLALIGWIYFPLRQWLMTKLFKSAEKQNKHLNRLIQKLFSAQTAQELNQLWQSTLAETWHTLSFEEAAGQQSHSKITGEGQRLKVPHLSEQKHLIFSYPNQGSRLFNREDLETAALFYQIGQQALSGLGVRQQAIEEKNRIFGDLHDDVGAKLLSLLYKTEDAELNQITRSALKDLREIVSQPDASAVELNKSLGQWQQEMQLRLKDGQIKLHWTQASLGQKKVSTLTLNHIMRILREATNNILKHAHADTVWVDIQLSADNTIVIEITDNGQSADPTTWILGRGTRNIRHRSKLLNGLATWQKVEPQGCQLSLRLPLKTNP